ncbi:MAG: hypothetical protein F6K41_24910 [Symploca sp. SIO3E6]|nr:hypothetical protein [Caldora sp. SIO3E6]
MDAVRANIQGLGKWELVYSGSRNKGTGQRQIELELPVLLSAPLVLIGAVSFDAKAHWKRAGSIIQYAQNVQISDQRIFPDTGTPGHYADIIWQAVYLNQIKLFRMSQLVPEYRLWFQGKHWIDSINLDIWEYKGEYLPSQEMELLESIKIDLAEISPKLS